MNKLSIILTLVISGFVCNASGDDDFISIVRRGDFDRVKTMVDNDPTLVNLHDGGTAPLYHAVSEARFDIAKFLLDHGADVNVRTENDRTPILSARSAEMARLLIERGATVKLQAEYSITPLREAVRNGHVGVVNQLLAAGEKLDFDMAVELGETKLVAEMLAEKSWLAKPPRKPLFYAAEQGNLELTRLLLKYGADPDIDYGFVNISGPYTALTNAVTGDHYEMAKLLLENGASPNVSGGRNHDNLFIYAIAYCDAKFTKLMLDHGADIFACDSSEENSSALHVACSLGGSQTVGRVGRVGQPNSLTQKESQALQKVKYVVEAEADVNCRTTSGATPLLGAAIAGNNTVCDFLLANGAKLDIASACMLRKLKDVKSIVTEQPDLIAKTEVVLHLPVVHWAVRSGDVAIVEYVLSQGADVDARAPELEYEDAGGFSADTYRDSQRPTPLHVAASLGQEPIFHLLLQRGANAELMAGDKDDMRSVLETAIDARQWEIVRLLLDQGQKFLPEQYSAYDLAQLDDSELLWRLLSSIDGFDFASDLATSLLASAIRRADATTIERLTARGAKLDIYSASELGRTDDVRRLIESDARLVDESQSKHPRASALELAVQGGHIDVVRLMMDHGAKPQEERYLVHQAAMYGHLEILKFLARNGLLREINEKGETLLHSAAAGLQPQIVQYLIEQGLDVNARDFDRATPFCTLGDITWRFLDANEDDSRRAAETAKRLLDAGADVNAIDRFESTPLHNAAGHGFADVARQLLSHGADVNRRDDTHRTPLSRVKSRFWWSPDSKSSGAVEKVLLDFGAVR